MRYLNKKGQMNNYLVVPIFLFSFGFLSMLGMVLFLAIKGAFTDMGYWEGPLATAGQGFFNALMLIDYIMVIMLVVLIIGVGITSFKLNTAPIFFIVTILMGSFLGFISFMFNYIFIEIISDGVFAPVLVYFPNTQIICTNLHWVALAAIVVGSITLYAKKEQVGAGGSGE